VTGKTLDAKLMEKLTTM